MAMLTLIVCLGRHEALAGKMVRMTDADNNHAATLAPGDSLMITLSSTPGTGYGWQLIKLDDKVLRQSGQPKLIHESKPMPGSPAKQVFRFIAKHRGTTALKLDYVRPSEHNVPPARTFRVEVTVE
jgi:predicted secreted protein